MAELEPHGIARLVVEEWIFISLAFYIAGYARVIRQILSFRTRHSEDSVHYPYSSALLFAIVTLSYLPIITYMFLNLLQNAGVFISEMFYYYIRTIFLFIDIFQPIFLCLLFTSFAFSPVHAAFYAKLCIPPLCVIYLLGLVYEFNSEPNYVSTSSGYTSNVLIHALSVVAVFNIIMTIFINCTVRSRFLKVLESTVTSRKCLYMLCQESTFTKWTENLLEVITVLNVKYLSVTLLTRFLTFLNVFLPVKVYQKIWIFAPLANLVTCTITFELVVRPKMAARFCEILFNKRSRHLFNIYITQTGAGNQQLFFLTDAAAYQNEVAVATDTTQMKDILIRVYYAWFIKTPIFSTEIYNSVTETVISLLSLPHSDGDLQGYKKLFIRCLRDAEISVSHYISHILLEKYQRSRIGFMEYVYNTFFCLARPCRSDKMAEDLITNVFALKRDAVETKEIVDTVTSNPYTIMHIPNIIALYLPAHEIKYTPSGDIKPPLQYKSRFLVQETHQQLLALSIDLLNTDAITDSQKKLIRLYLKEMFMRQIQHQLFVRDQDIHLETIHYFFGHLIGKRNNASLRNPLLNKYDDRSRKETMNINNYLSDLRSSVTHIEQSIDNAVDAFLSGTFCARDSITDDGGHLSYSLVRDSFSADDMVRQAKIGQRVKVRGQYLACPTPQIPEKNYKTIEELSASEKAFLKSIIISRSKIVDTEHFIMKINEDVYSQYPHSFFSQGCEDYQDYTTGTLFPAKVSKNFKKMTNEAMASYWANIILNGSVSDEKLEAERPEKLEHTLYTLRSSVSNHKKLFRLLFSCIQYFELSHYKIPPQSLSDLCYKLTTNEVSSTYYCSSRSILVLRQVFIFLAMLQKGSHGLLSDAQILGLLLGAACSYFNHVAYTEDGVISSQQWLAGVYNDRSPIMNYTAASGWILMRESGVLINIPQSTCRIIRTVYINFLRAICKKALVSNYVHLLSEMEHPIKKDTVCDFSMRVCLLYAAIVAQSDQLSNKSNAIYLSLLNYAEKRHEEQILTYSLYTDESYLIRITPYMDLLPPTEYAKSLHVFSPPLDLIEQALVVIGNVLEVPVDSWLKDIEFLSKDLRSVGRLWANILLRK